MVTPADIIMACPHIMPFAHSRDYYASYARPLPRPLLDNDQIFPLEKEYLKIDAILVFNDSRDWALDIQIILDLLFSHAGILGTTSRLNNNISLPNRGFQQDGQPPLYFSNPDLLWAAHYHLPRLGQGGFRRALEGAWNGLTGGFNAGVTLKKHMFGKPNQKTFEFAERRLMEHREELFGLRKDEGNSEKIKLKQVYMVGGTFYFNLPVPSFLPPPSSFHYPTFCKKKNMGINFITNFIPVPITNLLNSTESFR